MHKKGKMRKNMGLPGPYNHIILPGKYPNYEENAPEQDKKAAKESSPMKFGRPTGVGGWGWEGFLSSALFSKKKQALHLPCVVCE